MAAGCGKKADPFCPSGEKPPAVTDLKVSGADGAVVLSWTVPEGVTGRGTCRVYRSALPPGEGCPGCPRRYVPFRVLYRGDLPERGSAVIEDRDVEERTLYGYRLVLCDDRGVCGSPSNEAEILFGGKKNP